MHHFYFFLKINYNLVVVIKALVCLTYSDMTEMIDIRPVYVHFSYSFWMRWFNRIKVDKDIVVSVKIRNMVMIGCVLADELRTD